MRIPVSMETNVVALVSVIIPCYRCVGTITRAVASVANQTHRPVEVILVDDCSGDGTVMVLRALKAQYGDWIKLIELPENVGAGSARNAGWSESSQPYIAFLDSDDVWHPKKLEIQLHQFQIQPDLVLSGHTFRFPWDDELMIDPNIIAAAVTRTQILWKNPFVTPSVMLRKDIPLRFQSGKRHMEDHLLWQEIVLSGYQVSKLNIPLATIHKLQFGASGLSSQLWAMQMGEMENYFQLHRRKYIGSLTALFFSIYSFAKFGRRLAIVSTRRVSNVIKKI